MIFLGLQDLQILDRWNIIELFIIKIVRSFRISQFIGQFQKDKKFDGLNVV